MKNAIPGLQAFLSVYREMGLRPSRPKQTRLEGRFVFEARFETLPLILDDYHLAISLPDTFPVDLPTVWETGGKIARIADNHVNEDDHSLCLGTPLRLQLKLSERPDLLGFAETCLVPFLYGHSYKRIFKTRLPFGELDHGDDGKIKDYKKLFDLQTSVQVLQVLKILAANPKQTKNMKCPCGCGGLLRNCKFQERIQVYRK